MQYDDVLINAIFPLGLGNIFIFCSFTTMVNEKTVFTVYGWDIVGVMWTWYYKTILLNVAQKKNEAVSLLSWGEQQVIL